jgi:hypothetical protein
MGASMVLHYWNVWGLGRGLEYMIALPFTAVVGSWGNIFQDDWGHSEQPGSLAASSGVLHAYLVICIMNLTIIWILN